MEGVVDFVMRQVLSEMGGLDRCTTEFVRVTDALLPTATLLKSCPELMTDGKTRSGVPVVVQLLGGQPEWLAKNAVLAVQMGAPGIDLNFGCPAKTVNRHDGGATLLKNPHRLYDCVAAVRDAVPSAIPVSAKVRLGFDHKDECVSIAENVARAGASLLTIHARTRAEGYLPPAHWEFIQLMKSHISIPVAANGDIWNPGDGERCRRVTGCDILALGRGFVARPSLARELKGVGDFLSWAELWPRMIEFGVQSQVFRNEAYAVGRLKQWCRLLTRNYPEAAMLFDKMKVMHHLSALLRLIKECPYEHRYESPRHHIHLGELPVLHSS
jgi:tRNA-dihydrouridine synthase C